MDSANDKNIPQSSPDQPSGFEPPRLTPLGRVTDLTKDFITPGAGDFTLTGFLS